MSASPPEDLAQRYDDAGQNHVFRYWDRLDGPARERFVEQLRGVDLALLRSLVKPREAGTRAVGQTSTTVRTVTPLEAPQTIRQLRSDADMADTSMRDRLRTAREMGEAALREGRVAAFVVAGGQASRLGIDGPKGCVPFGPVTGRSLFEMFARQIAAIRKRYECALPWVIMTSPGNREASERAFADAQFFGLEPDSVTFITQGEMPAVDFDGKLLLADEGSLFLSPNGHGGCFDALRDSGALDALAAQGIEALSYFQVDNPLARIADEVFIGLHRQTGSEFSSKAVSKLSPDEKVGVIVRQEGKTRLLEYSQLSKEQTHDRTPEGRLTYNAGNAAIHIIDIAFVQRVAKGDFDLPYHPAKKVVPHLDAQGRRVNPEAPNGYKFERFLFDALPYAANPLVYEIQRDAEFYPIKNASGEFSLQSAQQHYQRYWASVLIAAGCAVPLDGMGVPTHPIEIDPAFALDESELATKAAKLRPPEGPWLLAPFEW